MALGQRLVAYAWYP